MRTFNPITLLASCLLFSLFLMPQSAFAQKKIALLIGVNKYVKPGFTDLSYAERDVIKVGSELKKLGFEVTTLLGSGEGTSQATRQNILNTANQLVSPLNKKDMMIVMLAGHGQQFKTMVNNPNGERIEKEDSYYCPVDAIKSNPEYLFSISHLVDAILAPNVGRKMILVDACRDAPKDAGRGVQGRVVALPEDTAVLFSCRAGQQSSENDILQHGVFTHCVLEGLRGSATRSDELSWGDLSAYVTRRMASKEIKQYISEHRPQVPIPAGGISYTVLGKSTSGTSPAPQKVTPSISNQPKEDPDYLLGMKFYLGLDGENINRAKAFRHFKIAADRGHTVSKTYEVGQYAFGLGGIRKDLDRANRMARSFFPELLQVANNGDANAQNQVALFYQSGIGVQKDQARSLYWYKKSAEQKEPYAYVNLGLIYEYGLGVEVNLPQAFSYYKLAAKSHHAESQLKVGQYYYFGAVVQQNYLEAAYWYRKCADRNLALGQAAIASMYERGEGVGYDPEMAFYWYLRAANQKNPQAIIIVGNFYYDGFGTQVNYKKAVEWYRKAANTSDKEVVDAARLRLRNMGYQP